MGSISSTSLLVAVVVAAGASASCTSPPNSTSTLTQIRTTATSPNVGADVAPSPIVGTVRLDAALKDVFPTIDALARSARSELVVRGIVTDVAYVFDGQLARTKLTVSVEQSWRGPAAPQVVVWEDGGFVPAADFAAANADKQLASRVTGWIDVRFEGASHPHVGDHVVLFLARNPNPGQQGTYQEVSSVYGRLTQDPGGASYSRAVAESRWQRTMSVADLGVALPGL